MSLRTNPILLIEDNPTDKNNIESALENMQVKSQLVHSSNSEEALNYLRGQDNKKPWLILLGLNAQSPDGFDFLKVIKSDDNLKEYDDDGKQTAVIYPLGHTVSRSSGIALYDGTVNAQTINISGITFTGTHKTVIQYDGTLNFCIGKSIGNKR